MALLAVFSSLIVMLMYGLSDKREKPEVLIWSIVGVLAGIMKVLLIQSMPQWHDVPSDALKYQKNALAFSMHWAGEAVPAVPYELSGYLSAWHSNDAPTWLPTDTSAYAGVLGTHEWLYAAFAGFWALFSDNWMQSVITANAILAGSMVAATFMICRILGGEVKVSRVAALIILFDPLMAVNGAWLIKDSLAAFLTAIAVISVADLYKKFSWKFFITLVGCVGLLAGVRFIAFVAFIALMFFLAVYLLYAKRRNGFLLFSSSMVVCLAALIIINFLPFGSKIIQDVFPVENAQSIPILVVDKDGGLQGAVDQSYGKNKSEENTETKKIEVAEVLPLSIPVPVLQNADNLIKESVKDISVSNGVPSTPQVGITNVVKTFTAPISGQVTTLAAQKGESGADQTVIEWRQYFLSHPVLATIRAVARTLFAPYPWSIIKTEISGKNYIELYLFATFFWVAMLPGTLYGIYVAVKRSKIAAFQTLLVFLIIVPYLVFFGEWSTRQRVFMLPLLYAFSAIGWHALRQRYLEKILGFFKYKSGSGGNQAETYKE